MTAPTDSPGNGLRDYPVIAVEIACFLSNFNMLETILHLVFAQMIGDKIGVTHAMLSPLNSFGQKLGIMIDVAKLFNGSAKAKALLSLDTSLREIVSFRNLLAHSSYFAENNKVEAVSYFVSNRKIVSTELTIDLFQQKGALLKKAHESIEAVLDQGIEHAYTRGRATP